MPKKKAVIFQALKPSHLQCIGRVAAEWSTLEFMFQMAIADVAGWERYKSMILTKSGHVRGWKDMLRTMVETVYSDKTADKELVDLYKKIEDLNDERNAIVHTTWEPQIITAGLLAGPLPIGEKVFGYSFPKGGMKVMVPIEKTATQMRQVARDIEKARESLIDIVTRARHRASQRKQLAQVVSQRSNRRGPGTPHTQPAPSQE